MTNDNYIVMINYNINENSRDIRCRGDIGLSPYFQRCNNSVTYYGEKSTKPKVYYIVYEGPKKQAQRFAETLKLCYVGLGTKTCQEF